MKEELRRCEDEVKFYREALREIELVAKNKEGNILKLIEGIANKALNYFN